MQFLESLKKEPVKFIVFTFLLTIAIGGTLLIFPFSSSAHRWTNPLDAYFTATSATCVTGLVVKDTGTYYSLFGQIVILFLIQIGGLGYMTMFTFLALLLGRRIPLVDRLALKESLNYFSVSGIIKLARRIFFTVLIFETLGAVSLFTVFYHKYGIIKGIWFGIFHSVSAFCNAGFDLIGGFRSFTQFTGNITLNLTVMLLIVFGGIGFPVISEIIDYPNRKKFSLHARVVFKTTIFLIVLGALLFFFFESSNPFTLKGIPMKEKVLSSLFQSITPRTAGFSTITTGKLKLPTLMFLAFFMFIGASPGGTGGGIKTTTTIVLFETLFQTIKGSSETIMEERTIERSFVRRAFIIFFASSVLVGFSTLVLSITEVFDLSKILFEVFSAFGTVGLSTGITPLLSPIGKLTIMFTMFTGRVGILTILTIITTKKLKRISLPEEKIMVG